MDAFSFNFLLKSIHWIKVKVITNINRLMIQSRENIEIQIALLFIIIKKLIFKFIE